MSLPRLVVLTRLPEPGVAKTRLICALGPEGAAETHRCLAEHTLRRLRPLDAAGELQLEVRVDGDLRAARGWLGRGVRCRSQGAGDLQERVAGAFRSAFSQRAERVVVVGSDCPALSDVHVRQAIAALDEADVVFGPAIDGGYYLIALRRRAAPAIDSLLGVEFSTDHVLRDTCERARECGLTVQLLEELRDVDTPADLPEWEGVRAETSRAPRTISVIVPALNEAGCVARAVESARGEPDVEVIVVDGGSTDATRDVAAAAGARVLTCEPGRARQLNAGAAEAAGEIVLFLHADTVLPHGFAEDVRRAHADESVAAAAFEFSVDIDSAAMRFVERTVAWRARRLRLPYGDQAPSMRASLFRAIGGFPDLPVMEDYELMLRLRRLGEIRIIPKPAVTSGRSWARHGTAVTTAVNTATILGYRLGVPPKQLARLRSRITRHLAEEGSAGLIAENDAQSV